MMNDDYLIHHGVKGMKWGVRRYQNPDGSLTAAGQKRLYRQVKRAKTYDEKSKLVKSALSGKLINDRNDSYEKVNKEFTDSAQLNRQMDEKIGALTMKYTKQLYNNEMKKNGSLYPTERAKQKLFDQLMYEKAYKRAEKEILNSNQQYKSSKQKQDLLFNDYYKKHKLVIDNVVGKYGDLKARDTQIRTRYRDVVEDILEEMNLEINNDYSAQRYK